MSVRSYKIYLLDNDGHSWNLMCWVSNNITICNTDSRLSRRLAGKISLDIAMYEDVDYNRESDILTDGDLSFVMSGTTVSGKTKLYQGILCSGGDTVTTLIFRIHTHQGGLPVGPID